MEYRWVELGLLYLHQPSKWVKIVASALDITIRNKQHIRCGLNFYRRDKSDIKTK